MRNPDRRHVLALAAGVMLLVASLVFPGAAQADEATDATDAEVGSITIVHTNDIHGNYSVSADDGSTVNYFSVVKGLADSAKADLVVDAGDTFHGNSFATICEGTSIARLMEAVGYDAMTPGNHDWSYGAEQLKALSSYVRVLAANVKTTGGENYFSDLYVTKDVELDNGETVQVGVFGVIDEDFYTSTPPTTWRASPSRTR